jgi:hypothetical protein
MRKKLIVSSLLLFTTLSFSYDFEKLKSSYSKKDFVSNGYDAFMQKVETNGLAHKMSQADIQSALESILDDLEGGDSELVIAGLADEGFDEAEIKEILKASDINTTELSANTLEHLGENRIDEVVDEYIKTGVIPEGYTALTKYFNRIKTIQDEIAELKKRGAEADKRGAEADKKLATLKRINALLDKINDLKKVMEKADSSAIKK